MPQFKNWNWTLKERYKRRKREGEQKNKLARHKIHLP